MEFVVLRAKHKLLCNGHAPCCIFNFSTQEGDLNEMSVAVNSDLYNGYVEKEAKKSTEHRGLSSLFRIDNKL
uniref:Uncharacterized protein n=1 Tax=Trichogramma kaykai TaxID=54128 RepID=A0ABD2XSB6_9HYME